MEFTMRAHQIMTRPVITVTPDTTIVEAAKIMLNITLAAFLWSTRLAS